jgi:Xaa-Pro aminopeptidase
VVRPVLLNRQRVDAFLRQCRLDALIATSPSNVLYVSDYCCWLDPLFKAYMMRPGESSGLSHNYAVLPAEVEPALVLPAIWAANAGDSWIKDIWLHGAGDLDLSVVPAQLAPPLERLRSQITAGLQRRDAIQALRELLLLERGLAGGRLGIELDGLGAAVTERLREALPNAELLDCSNLLRLMRMVKSDEEIRRLECSAQINYRAAMTSLDSARVGISVRELRERYVIAIHGAGAQLDHFIAAPRGTGLQELADYRLTEDDVTYVDFGCVYQHYYSDNGTTLVIGRFPTELERRYAVLRTGLQAGINRLKPGVRASEVHQAMFEPLIEGCVTGSNAHGHGLGLEVRDYPIVVRDTGLRICDDCVDVAADLPLEAGMVINLELPLYLFGVGSLHMEQTFLVTADGCRRLDSSEETQPVQVEREALQA